MDVQSAANPVLQPHWEHDPCPDQEPPDTIQVQLFLYFP